ncbi:TPA: hypothetical protein N0F65_004667, partial [Lagenidium giganteum]
GNTQARSNRLQFKIGDRVLLSTQNIPERAVSNLGSGKQIPRYIGPFKVINAVGDAYTLELPPTVRLHPTFYVGRLKQYWPTEPHLGPDHPASRAQPATRRQPQHRSEKPNGSKQQRQEQERSEDQRRADASALAAPHRRDQEPHANDETRHGKHRATAESRPSDIPDGGREQREPLVQSRVPQRDQPRRRPRRKPRISRSSVPIRSN